MFKKKQARFSVSFPLEWGVPYCSECQEHMKTAENWRVGIIATVVKSKQKSTCLDYDLAFEASSPATGEHRIIFNFDSEEYAQTFAALNSAELESNT